MSKDVITYKLNGIEDILNALEALTDREIYNIMRATVRKGMKQHIIDPIKAAIPYNNLKKAVGIVNKGSRDELVMWGGVTISKSKEVIPGTNRMKKPAGVLLRWLEFGTEERFTKKGAYRGTMKAKNFIIPTINNGVDNLVGFINNDFGTAVEEVLAKRLKSFNK